jgi:hypothetical protein
VQASRPQASFDRLAAEPKREQLFAGNDAMLPSS